MKNLKSYLEEYHPAEMDAAEAIAEYGDELGLGSWHKMSHIFML